MPLTNALTLILLVVFLAAGLMLVYNFGLQLAIERITDMFCNASGRTFLCNNDSQARLATQDLSNAISAVCDGNTDFNDKFVSCKKTTDGKGVSCDVSAFALPQGVITDWIPANGDPNYLVYYEMLDQGETVVWRNKEQVDFWFGIATAVVFNVPLPGVGPAQKLGSKVFVKAESWAMKGFVKAGAKPLTKVAESLVEKGALKKGFQKDLFGKIVTNMAKEDLEKMAKIIKGPVSLAAGRLAGKTAEDTVIEYLGSMFESALPCDGNSLCLKIPYQSPQVFKLSKSCENYYVELKKREGANSKFYLASPCYAQLEVKLDKCKCDHLYLVEDEVTGKTVTICDKEVSTAIESIPTDKSCPKDFSNTDIYNTFIPSEHDSKCTWKELGKEEVDCIKVRPLATTPKGLENLNFCYSPLAHSAFLESTSTAFDVGGIVAPIAIGATCLALGIATLGPGGVACAAVAFGSGVALDIGSLLSDDQATWPHGYLETG